MGREAYLAIDVGATKTLFAVFSPGGDPVCECKIKTDPQYSQFKLQIKQKVDELVKEFTFSHICCAVPGTIDFENGVALAFGNESWRNVPIKKDLEAMAPGAKVLINNDAKLAALSETALLQKKI